MNERPTSEDSTARSILLHSANVFERLGTIRYFLRISQLRQFLLGSFDPSVGTAFLEDFDGFVQILTGPRQVAVAPVPIRIEVDVLG
jgi:hypothetical protein